MATNYCLHLMTVELLENEGLNVCVLLVWGLFTTEHIDNSKKDIFCLEKAMTEPSSSSFLKK